MPGVPRLTGGDEICRTILPARRRPLAPPQLAMKLEPVIAEWITAAADWPDLGLGESRCLTFETTLAPGATFFVRFWSEPHSPLLCEIPSGHANAALQKWLRPDSATWAERCGLGIRGRRENYRRSFRGDSPLGVATAAAFVVDALVSMIDYQGLTALIAALAHDLRSGFGETLDSFSETEVARVFESEGFAVEWAETESGELLDPPMFRCRKAGTESIVNLMDPVPGCRLYQRVRFAADLPMTTAEAEEYRREGQLPPDGEGMVTISGFHAFTGGVRKEWLIERVREWDAALAEHRRELRRSGKRKPKRSSTSETIH